MKRTSRTRIQKAARTTTGDVLSRGGDHSSKSRQKIVSQAERAAANGISIRTQAKLDYLARYYPEKLAAVATGKISAERAYREVRGQAEGKTLTAKERIERLRRLLETATPEQRSQILQWIENHSDK